MNDLKSELEALAGNFSGDVFKPGDTGYDDARSVWNAMINRQPALITRCRDTSDVVATVKLAGVRELPIAIRAGGHNVAGHAVCDGGIMLDLSLMRGVEVDRRRRIAAVDGGALWRDVDAATQEYGLATPGGLISETGVAGLTLSGGIGWLRAQHGLSIDNLIAADVVTADGALIRASDDQNPDLLWALKGGGGNFGVVVRFEFALHPIGPDVMFAAPIYALEDGPGPIRAWRDFLARHGDHVASLCEFSTVAESEDFPEEFWGSRVYTLACVYNGDAREGEVLLQPLRDLGKRVADFSGRMDYCNVQQLFDTLMPAGEFRCYWKARYLTDLPNEMIDLAMRNASDAPSDKSLSSLWNLGGAISQVAADATAFGDRAMSWMYSLDGVWAEPAEDAANIAWSREGWSNSARFGQHGRAYLNFPGHGEDSRTLTRATFGSNYPRLAEIKRKYDPDNRFRFNQNIEPEVSRNTDNSCVNLVVAVVAAAILLSPVDATAHHSAAAYDTTTEITIEGSVAEVEWRNPHIGLTLEVVDEIGVARLQDIELVAVSEALALGLQRDDLAAGTPIVVRANPGRRGPGSRALGRSMRTADGAILLPSFSDGEKSTSVDSVESEGLSGRWVTVADDFLATPGVMMAWSYKDGVGEAVQRAFSEAGATLGICEAFPPPILGFFPEIREIEINGDTVSMRFEAQGLDLERAVRLDISTHPRDVTPSLMGHSIGWWEGDTLVIDTIAFEPHFIGIAVGVPSGPDKHLIERLTLADDRRHIRYEYELHDPSVLSAPASHAMLWQHRPDLEFSGIPCDPEMAERLVQ